MKVLIQCAASKSDRAGTLITPLGERVLFVADPSRCALVPPGWRYARPDDPNGTNRAPWRDVLNRYNEQPDNPHGLLRAADLYAPREREFRNLYRELADAFGWDNVFILSAGWGLIRASFWTPDYNITFSTQAKKAKPWVWRNTKDTKGVWLDFNHLQDAQISQDELIHFFGGKDYRPLFYDLVTSLPGKKIVHYKGDAEKLPPGFEPLEYKGPEKNRTWHYRAAKEFLIQWVGAPVTSTEASAGTRGAAIRGT
jgi:hypothetical protein